MFFFTQHSETNKKRGHHASIAKVTLLSLILLLDIFLCFRSAHAQSFYYVRYGATGANNGSDWNNAFASLPTTLVRGATYYIADGSYGHFTFNTVVSGTAYIYIKKATIANHGTNTGWQDGYGDGVATFTGLIFSTSYYDFDGQVGGGPYSWNTGHGFEVYRVTNKCGDASLITIGPAVSNIAIRHTKIFSDYNAYTIAGIKGVNGGSNITVSYCQISDVFGVLFHIGNWTDSTIEYSYLSRNKSTGAGGTPCADWHSEGISSLGTNSNITIRYNLWDRIEGTAVFAGISVGTSDNWQIYGNIFSRSTTVIYYYWEVPGTNQNRMINSKFLNNTIVGQSGHSQGGIVIQNGSNNVVYNNIWYDNIANAFGISATHDYQYADRNRRVADCNPPCNKDPELISGEAHGQAKKGNPFVSYNSDPLLANFKARTQAGLDTSALVPGNNSDMFGNQRAYSWERGALVYKTHPSPPTNLRISK